MIIMTTRNSILLLIFIAGICSGYAFKFTRTDLDEANIKGSVKSVKTYHFYHLDDTMRESPDDDTTYGNFLASGPQLSYPLPEYKCLSIEYNEYNKDGMLTGITVYSTDEANPTTYRNSDVLTHADLKSNEVYCCPLTVVKILYDNEGFPVSRVSVNTKGDTIAVRNFKIQRFADNVVISSELTEANIFVTETNEKTYTPEGKIKSAKSCSYTEDCTYTYDDNELIIGVTCMGPGSLDPTREPHSMEWAYYYEYSPNEVLTYFEDDDNPRQLYNRDQLDDYGNIISATDFDDDGNVNIELINEYFYDSNGNWTKSIEYDEDANIVIVNLREIEYY